MVRPIITQLGFNFTDPIFRPIVPSGVAYISQDGDPAATDTFVPATSGASGGASPSRFSRDIPPPTKAELRIERLEQKLKALPYVRESRYNTPDSPDIKLRHLPVGIFHALLGSALEMVLNGATSLYEVFPAAASMYTLTQKANTIGPNLKALIYVLGIPSAAILTPPLVTLGSGVFGLWRGFTSGLNKGLKGTLTGTMLDQAYIRHFSKDIIQAQIEAYKPDPLEPGTKPIDIRVGESLRGALAGLTATVPMGVGVFLTSLGYSPKVILKAWQNIWSDGSFMPVLSILTSFLTPIAVLLLLVLSPVAGMAWGIGRGAYYGYTKGYVESLQKSLGDLADYRKALREFVKS